MLGHDIHACKVATHLIKPMVHNVYKDKAKTTNNVASADTEKQPPNVSMILQRPKFVIIQLLLRKNLLMLQSLQSNDVIEILKDHIIPLSNGNAIVSTTFIVQALATAVA